MVVVCFMMTVTFATSAGWAVCLCAGCCECTEGVICTVEDEWVEIPSGYQCVGSFICTAACDKYDKGSYNKSPGFGVGPRCYDTDNPLQACIVNPDCLQKLYLSIVGLFYVGFIYCMFFPYLPVCDGYGF